MKIQTTGNVTNEYQVKDAVSATDVLQTETDFSPALVENLWPYKMGQRD